MNTATLYVFAAVKLSLEPPPASAHDTWPAPPPVCGLPVPGGCCTRHPDHDGDCAHVPECAPTLPALPADDDIPEDIAETPFRCAGEVECPDCGGEGTVMVRCRGYGDDCDTSTCPTCRGDRKVVLA